MTLTIPFTLDHGAKEPRRAHQHDAGFDLALIEETRVPMGGHTVATTGVHVNIPPGHYGQVHVRSSLGIKRHIVLSNGTGIIDAGYTGPIKLSFHNTGREPVWLRAGEYVAQLIILPLPTVTFTPVASLDETERGEDGFGSTGTGAAELSNDAKAILSVLQDVGVPVTPEDLSGVTDIRLDTVNKCLRGLASSGHVIKLGPTMFCAADDTN